MSEKKLSIDELCVAALRATAIDEINTANSGHPGMALDAAPAMYALYRDHLKADPSHPHWENRDRLVYSSGHASALIYALLHFAGYSLTLDDLKKFRQYGSRTPGHPEVTLTSGIDATSGPLGQGIAQAVGMAIAEKHIEASYPEGSRIMDHYTYCLCGDGCLEEGVSQEAISLAGHYRLNKLILFYDQNGSTLDGPTSDSLSESTKLRFAAEEWNVIEVQDGNDVEVISKAIAEAKKSALMPTMILLHTVIGYGSSKQGTHATHGAPLGEEDGRYAKLSYGYDYPDWTIPAEVYEHFGKTFAARGKKAYEEDQEAFASYEKDHPKDAKVFQDAFSRNLAAYPFAPIEAKESEATRNSSGRCLQNVASAVPFLFGGSADVAGSTKTSYKGAVIFDAEHPEGRDVHWGIREFAMAGAVNGILLHGGLVSYCSTFFVFSDYCKAAIRMAAMEKLPALYILTHDSLAVGEDGMTHQPIEQLAMLRAIPGVHVIRPADCLETEQAYRSALSGSDHPTVLVLTRQNLPLLPLHQEDGVKKGAYFVKEEKDADLEILATGSEVSLALDAAKILEREGKKISVVSMPDLEAFEEQDPAYQDSILAVPYEKRVSLEMASTFGWGKYALHHIGVDRFGASGKASDVMTAYGFTSDKIADVLRGYLA